MTKIWYAPAVLFAILALIGIVQDRSPVTIGLGMAAALGFWCAAILAKQANRERC